MSDPLSSDSYADLVRRVLAGDIEPEAAALEAVNMMGNLKSAGPTGFTLSFLDVSDADASRLGRFAKAAKAEVIRRLAPGPDAV
jgi:hypothetical protein